MNKGFGLFVGLAALFAMGSAHAACPEPLWCTTDINDATGHVFEVYKAEELPGTKRRIVSSFCDGGTLGAKGHLATITSSSENEWVVDELLIDVAECCLRGYEKPGLGGWTAGRGAAGDWRRLALGK